MPNQWLRTCDNRRVNQQWSLKFTSRAGNTPIKQSDSPKQWRTKPINGFTTLDRANLICLIWLLPTLFTSMKGLAGTLHKPLMDHTLRSLLIWQRGREQSRNQTEELTRRWYHQIRSPPFKWWVAVLQPHNPHLWVRQVLWDRARSQCYLRRIAFTN